MATYVLIHGAWHGGWCYRDVAARLRAGGHTVFTPTLSGNGASQHLGGQHITLETHVCDVTGLIETEELGDVILVGHSYGGMVITGVADRLPQRLRRLVYLDAFVPEPGDSLIACIDKALPQEFAAIYRAHFHSGGVTMMVPPLPGALFGATPATQAWMERHCNAQSLATFAMPALLGGAGAAVAKSYIVAEDWRPSPFQYFAVRAEQAGWPLTRMAGGHGLMMDSPEALAAVLLALA
ncbi:MAG: alpha/beta fold hydrolase [Nevskia sp.]